MNYFLIAVRNIERNRRRSALTIASLVIGVTMLMNVQGVFRGLTSTVYGHMMAMDTAQVQVEAPGYRREKRRLPLDLLLADAAALADRARAVPGVAAVTARLDFSLELTNGADGLRVIGRGIDPEEADVTDLGRALKAGRLPSAGESGLVIGAGLAAKLKLALGDVAFFTALDRFAARNLGAMPILGIFEYGYPLLDDYLVCLDRRQTAAFLALDAGAATRLVIRGAKPRASRALAAAVGAALAAPAGAAPAAVAYDWTVFAENLVSTVETRIQLLRVIIGVLFALVAAGIFNTMAMNVQERYREIGTMRAIGLRRRQLRTLFFVEGLCMGMIGCVAAIVPCTLAGLFLGIFGLDVSAVLPRDVPIPFGSAMRAAYALSDVLTAVGAALAAASLGALLPARRAGRLTVADTLGTVR